MIVSSGRVVPHSILAIAATSRGHSFFCEPFFASEACEPAYIADVPSGVVFRGRCPPGDDVLYAYGLVLVAIGAEQAERGSDAPFHAFELNELPVRGSPHRGGSEGVSPFQCVLLRRMFSGLQFLIPLD